MNPFDYDVEVDEEKSINSVKPEVITKGKNRIIDLFEKKESDIKQTLPNFLDYMYFKQCALSEFTKLPKLYLCDEGSIKQAIMNAVASGIVVGDGMHKGYFIPRYDKRRGVYICNFEPGYKGILDHIYRSGKVKVTRVGAAMENDEFSFNLADGTINHNIDLKCADRGRVLAFWAKSILISNEAIIEVMSREEVIEVMRCSSTYKSSSSPWQTFPLQMGKKSVLRRHANYLPLESKDSSLLALALEIDNAQYEFDKMNEPKALPAKGGAGTALLSSALKADKLNVKLEEE
jgi:recombination protein RecT